MGNSSSEEQSHIRIVVLGEPGTGKTTITNNFIGEQKSTFRSDAKPATKSQSHTINGVTITDTPGVPMGDKEIRAYATQLKKAFSHPGLYKIVFVILYSSSCMESIYFKLINSIVPAIELAVGSDIEYGIIINKLSENNMLIWGRSWSESNSGALNILLKGLKIPPTWILPIPLYMDVFNDKNNLFPKDHQEKLCRKINELKSYTLFKSVKILVK